MPILSPPTHGSARPGPLADPQHIISACTDPARTFKPDPLPLTEEFGERELTLPLHPALSAADVDRVVAALREALDRPARPAPEQEA